MALLKAKPITKPANVCKPPAPEQQLEESSIVKVFDVPIELIDGHEENPNAMSDATFDELCEGMRKDGFDEPCLVVPKIDDKGVFTGRYLLASGHHRTKAAKVIGMKKVPCILKPEWNDIAIEANLVRRNMLRGTIDPEKFTKLYNKAVGRGMDREMVKRMMGLTEKKAFEQLYKSVADKLPPRQKAKLEEAKETIRSVDDLSSVLNTIFKENGSNLESDFLVFSFGGKKHHYFKVSQETHKLLGAFEQELITSGRQADDVWKQLLSGVILSGVEKSVTVKASGVHPKPIRKKD